VLAGRRGNALALVGFTGSVPRLRLHKLRFRRYGKIRLGVVWMTTTKPPK
jgi:hypothetical protein